MHSATPASLKIEGAAFAVTVDASRRVVADASILIEGRRIARIGKTGELREAPAERTIDARGCVVLPAFVNGHMHISYAHAVRGNFPDDFVSRERLREVFRLQRAMREEEEYWTSLLAVIELLKSGTVTFVDPGSTKFVDACLQAYADAGVRVISGAGVVDRASDLALPLYPTSEALARTEAFIRAYDGRLDGRLHAWAMPFSPDTCSPELLSGARGIATEHGTWMTIHHTGGATHELDSIGALGANVLLSHAPGISDAEVDLIAACGATVVMCPSTTLKEGSGLGARKLPELLARGVPVGLGCDSGNSSNFLDGVRMMNAAALGFKDERRDVASVPAEQAVEMATLLGAHAVGLGSEIGSLEVGKKADVVVFDALRAEWRSLLDPVNNLVYSADGRSVRWVVADGRVVVDDGQVTFADERGVAERVQAIGEDLLARTGTSVNRGRWPIV
jgi:cytosine/adenosine deaminase-related metal-dependent hydrolase